MTKELLLIVLLAVAVSIAAAVLKGGRRRATGNIRQKKLLTEREQPMFFRLQQAFPDDVVLSQVAFSALLTAKDLPTRSTFNRKVADFVVATKAFEVLAVIELDDNSHKSREAHDDRRDQLLERAGYRVLRFKHVPDVDDVRRAVRPPASLTRPATPPGTPGAAGKAARPG